MKNLDFITNLTGVDEEQMEKFRSRAMDQRYSSILASMFVNSRLLNYWVEENKLLSKWDRKGWRRFSFIELVWLKIISELREFGVKFEVLQKLKKELFYIPDIEGINAAGKMMQAKKAEIAALLSRKKTKNAELIKTIVEKFEELKENYESSQIPVLLQYVFMIALLRSPGSLLINKDGEHMFLSEASRDIILSNEENMFFYESTHISISLTDIVEYFIMKDEIDHEMQEQVFSDQELKILELLRKEKPKSITIKFDKQHKPYEVEIEQVKKADIAHRLGHIIIKKGYEEIKITTQQGKIQTLISKQKIRL